MEEMILETLRKEIDELETELTRRTALWLRMQAEHEQHRAERRAEQGPCTDLAAEEELAWEQEASLREYHRSYIEPLEEQLAEKRRTLALFD